MIRSPFTVHEQDLIKRDLIPFITVFPNLKNSFTHYWKYLQKGENPSLEILLIKKIDENMKNVTEDDIDGLVDLFLNLVNENPFDSKILLSNVFPALRNIENIDKRSISIVIQQEIDILHEKGNFKNYFIKKWAELLSEFHKSVKSNFVFYSNSYFSPKPSFPYIDSNDEIILLDFFAEMFDITEEDDRYYSSGSFSKWNIFGKQFEGSVNDFNVAWEIFWIDTKIPIDFRFVNQEYFDNILENLLSVFQLFRIKTKIDLYTPISVIIEEMEVNRKEEYNKLYNRNKRNIRLKILKKPVIKNLKDNLSLKVFNFITKPDIKVHDLYTFLLLNLGDKNLFKISNLIDYALTIYDYLFDYYNENFSNIYTNCQPKKLLLYFKVSGPTIIDNTDYKNHFNEVSITDKMDHPFIRLSRKTVINSKSLPSYSKFFFINFNSPSDTILNQIEEWLSSILIIIGDNYLVTLKRSLIDQYKKWCEERKVEFSTQLKIKAIWPLITSDNFLDKLDQWEDFGNSLLNELKHIKDSMASLVNSEVFDLDFLRGILKNEYDSTGKTFFRKNDVLELWANKNVKFGKLRSTDYQKSLLRDRLKQIIDNIKENGDPELYIKEEKHESGRGAPRVLICLRILDDFNNKVKSSI